MTDDELKRLLAENAAETRRYMDERFNTVDARFNAVDASVAELRRHFDVTSEALRHDIRLVEEKITNVDEKLDREAADIRQEMRQGFAETQAMIKFSHAELDRRVRTLEERHRSLEERLADLAARVEQLEASTH